MEDTFLWLLALGRFYFARESKKAAVRVGYPLSFFLGGSGSPCLRESQSSSHVLFQRLTHLLSSDPCGGDRGWTVTALEPLECFMGPR